VEIYALGAAERGQTEQIGKGKEGRNGCEAERIDSESESKVGEWERG
jgi:hypothetical protein